MSFESSLYESNVYKRLEESVFEYFDEDMIDKLVPHLKKALCGELAARRKGVTQLESVMNTLFPGEGYASTEQSE